NKVAGVQLVDNNEPGGSLTIRIRGATSVNASSDPLYVIDGLPVGTGGIAAGRDPLNFLNPDDVESITVLKGGEAASIYGANAASGVVDRTGFGQQHDVVVSGAGQSNNYRLSIGYLKQNGIIQGSSTERVSLGFNYAQRLFDDRMSVRTSLKGSRTLDQFLPGNVLGNAAQMGPTQPVYDDTAATGYYNWGGNALQSADNPAQILALAQSHGNTYRSLGNVQADYRFPFLEGLRANVNLGYDVTKVDQQSF